MIKPRKTVSRKKIEYSDDDWRRFERFREDAEKILAGLRKFGVEALAHGSVARGDVNKDSDIDIVTLHTFPSYKVELALEESGFKKTSRKIVMATPWQLPKAHISIGENRMITFPLEKPKKLEEEFYRFSGSIDLDQVKSGKRVPGIDKRLVLIEPIEKGHRESQVVGREGKVAKILGVSLDIVEERVQVLKRRDEIGRTGVFLERELTPDENFEAVWKEIVENNSEVRQRLEE